MTNTLPLNVLWFNLATDADDSLLGFTAGWIAAAARRVRSIQVLTMRAGRHELPANVRVHSVGKELGIGRAGRLVRFYATLASILRTGKIDACFSHMIPVFVVLGAPLLQARRIPIVLWHAHPSVPPMLRAAHHLSSRIVTSLPTAYRYRHDKLTVIGQGIDTNLFAPDEGKPDRPPTILCAGRISPVKDHPTLLRAAAELRRRRREPFAVSLVGGPARDQDVRYMEGLRDLANELGIGDIVRFEQAVAPDRLPEKYRRATLNVNLTPTGSGDKVVLEAMSCGSPTVVCNEGFLETLGDWSKHLFFRHGNAHELAERLGWVLDRDDDERRTMGRYLRARVEGLHNLGQMTDRLTGLLASEAGLAVLR